MAARHAPEGATESGIGARQRGLAGLGRAPTPGGETDQPRSDTQRRDGSADLLPSVTLPKGGGAIRGIGEKFRSTPPPAPARLDLPLPLSPGRSGFTPAACKLAYDSGSGNGPFGFGWSLGAAGDHPQDRQGIAALSRRRRIRRFHPLRRRGPGADPGCERRAQSTVAHGATASAYQIAFYRPRIEGLFSRIERWTAAATGISHWRSISRDNVTTLYGYDAASRIADPADPTQDLLLAHLPQLGRQGQRHRLRLHRRGRRRHRPSRRRTRPTGPPRPAPRRSICKTIRYGNSQPYFPDWTAGSGDGRCRRDWMFAVVLDYGDHAPAAPTPHAAIGRGRCAPIRSPPIAPASRCAPIAGCSGCCSSTTSRPEPSVGANCLVRSIDLVYSDQQTPPDPRNPIYTFLVSATQTGYRARRRQRRTADPCRRSNSPTASRRSSRRS